MKLAIDSSAKKYITEHGFDPEYGARHIKRLIQKAILDNLADRIIKGEIKDGSKIRVRGEASGIRVTA
jgi:ATP-dependent Clp protease ATP-binding subunit ClpB